MSWTEFPEIHECFIVRDAFLSCCIKTKWVQCMLFYLNITELFIFNQWKLLDFQQFLWGLPCKYTIHYHTNKWVYTYVSLIVRQITSITVFEKVGVDTDSGKYFPPMLNSTVPFSGLMLSLSRARTRAKSKNVVAEIYGYAAWKVEWSS